MLPWQTRWFADASLAGWPWEQGRWSLYASWVFVIATILIGFVRKSERPAHLNVSRQPSALQRKLVRMLPIGVVILLSVIAAVRDPQALPAIAQWWIQVGLLVGFALTLWRANVQAAQVGFWFLLSLLPHVALGYWQYAIQRVYGHAWVGIATQFPWDPGVSVVEHGLFRVLRMYGGFPHPNIFGGWLAIGTLVSVWFATTAAEKRRSLAWAICSACLSVALLLTYARGAWVAAFVGLIILCIFAWRARASVTFQFCMVAILVSSLAVLVVGISQRDHVLTRFRPSERLEAKSIDARVTSLATGMELFRRHPWVGSGPNAELLELSKARNIGRSPEPLEPPHTAYLLALVDLGLLGVFALAWIFARRFIHPRTHFSERRATDGILLLPILLLALADHYPWSTWSGQTLVMVIALLAPMFVPPPQSH